MERNHEIEILLVEDNESDAELAKRVFKKHGITSTLVHLKDGAEAIHYIEGTGTYANRNIANKPKVILLDLKMPKVNGLEVLERLKGNPSNTGIPVVILTSSKENTDVEKCYAAGANSYVVKPVEYEYYSVVLTNILNFWINTNYKPV